MACYHPKQAWRAPIGTSFAGGRVITFTNPNNPEFIEIKLPCGKCVGCQRKKVKDWTTRIMKEARFHLNNEFVTLTYDEDHLPEDGSLHPEHITNFFKRLRADGYEFRYFQCGEYGSESKRPHHHVIFFGLNFHDEVPFYDSVSSYRVSNYLAKKWPYGFHLIGDLTEQSAAYVAGYVAKKFYGSPEEKEKHYEGRHPEYVTMSRRPGIGTEFYESFKSDIYPSDFIINSSGNRCGIPSFYDKKLKRDDLQLYFDLKERRLLYALDEVHQKSAEQLEVEERYYLALQKGRDLKCGLKLEKK